MDQTKQLAHSFIGTGATLEYQLLIGFVWGFVLAPGSSCWWWSLLGLIFFELFFLGACLYCQQDWCWHDRLKIFLVAILGWLLGRYLGLRFQWCELW